MPSKRISFRASFPLFIVMFVAVITLFPVVHLHAHDVYHADDIHKDKHSLHNHPETTSAIGFNEHSHHSESHGHLTYNFTPSIRQSTPDNLPDSTLNAALVQAFISLRDVPCFVAERARIHANSGFYELSSGLSPPDLSL